MNESWKQQQQPQPQQQQQTTMKNKGTDTHTKQPYLTPLSLHSSNIFFFLEHIDINIQNSSKLNPSTHSHTLSLQLNFLYFLYSHVKNNKTDLWSCNKKARSTKIWSLPTFWWYGPRMIQPQNAYARNMMAEHIRNLNTLGIAHLSVRTGICKTNKQKNKTKQNKNKTEQKTKNPWYNIEKRI